MIIRREVPADLPVIRTVTTAAFSSSLPPGAEPPETRLVDLLRADESSWVPALSLVALGPSGEVVGHVLGTRARIAGSPVLALGPLSVVPAYQRKGYGSALVHALLGAADALGEPLVALLGDPAYYGRFGFVAASRIGVLAPVPAWGDYFQVRTLASYDPGLRGGFAFADAFGQI